MQISEKSSILVTGGTGSFGKKFVELILKNFPNIKRLVVYSRDELKQFEMSQQFSDKKYSGIRYFIGDIRDVRRLTRACEGINIVVHAAALKQVPAAEYNPTDVATAIAPNCEQRIVGIRAGEKVHEEMITTSDAFTTVDCGKYYAILPVDGGHIERYLKMGAKMVEAGFSYNSGQNKQFLTVDELRGLIQTHVDPSFAV